MKYLMSLILAIWLVGCTSGPAVPPVWSTMASGDLEGPTQIAVNGNMLFATSRYAVLQSTDEGENWRLQSFGHSMIQDDFTNCLALSGSNLLAGTFSSGAYVSLDNGVSWKATNVTGGDVNDFVSSGNICFAIGTSVYRSTNNGVSWTTIPLNQPGSESGDALAVSGGIVYAGTWGGGAGVFRSFDNGDSWVPANKGLTIEDIYCLAANGSYVYAGVGHGGGVFVSSDNGDNWHPANTGLPSNVWVQSLAISGGVVYAGTMGSGVFVSYNEGSSWKSMNNNLACLYVTSIETSGNFLFAATDTGCYRFPLHQSPVFTQSPTSPLNTP
jgi:hypothetical protein